MVKEMNEDSQCCQKYGVPIYGASWVPSINFSTQKKPNEEEEEEEKEHVGQPQDETESASTQQNLSLVLCGGGGEGRSGIPNSILLTQFDSSSNSLSPEPVAKLRTGTDLPYRMAVHPQGEGLICSFPESCRWFEWEVSTSNNTCKLGLKSSEKVLSQLENVGQQLALTFNREGSVLAVGSEDGHLRVFNWPSMKVILDKAGAHPSVNDLDFSSDGKFLVSLGGRGPCRIWDVTSSTAIASLAKQNDEVFTSCRFSQTVGGTQILYITANRDRGGSIVSWDTTSWKRVASKQIVRDTISAFNVSPDGRLLSIGTVQGHVYVIYSNNMRVASVVRKAHLGLVTALRFSDDSRSLISASLDSSVRVTLINEKKQNGGLMIWVIIFIVLLLAYYLGKEALPIRTWFPLH